MSNKDNVFYGVSLPLDVIEDNESNDIKLVFDNKTEALEVVKKFKGSRFKAFDDIEDAILFSKEVIAFNDFKDNKKVENIEKSAFNGLHPRDLTSFRKAIERGDEVVVKRLIESNPRYLISSGDTPVVLMEGSRLNACHIAAKSGTHRVLELILNTVSDKEFMKLMFPSDKSEVTECRINYLLDQYLNNPDKVSLETPLHYGCKIGSIETVALLLSYVESDSEKVNKLGKKPSEVICDRSANKGIKTQILKLFEDKIYIPLLRDDSNARFGEPIKGAINSQRVSGLAGPMSPEQAQQLYQTLKSPLKCTPNDRKIRLTDSRKGLERIARNLCKDMNINWCEFWPFLDIRIDLTSKEGLNCLERHLRQQYYELDSKTHSFFKSEDFSEEYENSLNLLTNDISKLSINCSSSQNSDFLKEKESNQLIDSFHLQQTKPSLSVSSIESQLNICESDSDESYVSASSSPTFLFDFYIHGEKITREDIDAALALQQIIDSDLCFDYHFIQNWFKRVVREEPKHFDSLAYGYSPLSSTPIKYKIK